MLYCIIYMYAETIIVYFKSVNVNELLHGGGERKETLEIITLHYNDSVTNDNSHQVTSHQNSS